MLVTTAYGPDAMIGETAQALARRIDARYVARSDKPLSGLRQTYGAEEDILIVLKRQLRYYPAGGDDEHPLFFHPSMAAIRLKRIEQGEPDAMLRMSGVRPGDAVLDCTAGMASDAIVYAHAVGPAGEVVALESAPVMALLVKEGLASYESDSAILNAAMRRVQLLHAQHLAYLRALPDDRFDVIYFDPMFRKPVQESTWLSPLRRVVNPDPLAEEAIREAARVARRCVILKEHRQSGEFERLGFEPDTRSNAKIAYGVIRL